MSVRKALNDTPNKNEARGDLDEGGWQRRAHEPKEDMYDFEGSERLYRCKSRKRRAICRGDIRIQVIRNGVGEVVGCSRLGDEQCYNGGRHVGNEWFEEVVR